MNPVSADHFCRLSGIGSEAYAAAGESGRRVYVLWPPSVQGSLLVRRSERAYGCKSEVVDAESERDLEAKAEFGIGSAPDCPELLSVSQHSERDPDQGGNAGLSWPLPKDLDEAALESRLYPASPKPKDAKPMPDMAHIHQELRRRGVTLQLLWEEYKQAHPNGYQRTQFCHLYRTWAKTVDVTMRQVHIAGEKMFVDYAGQTVPTIDPSSGETREAQVFIAALGASNYIYAEPSWDQTLAS